MAEESGPMTPEPEQPARPAGKRPKVPLEVQEQKLTPRPSPWPIALAFSLVFTAIGVIVSPILFICGIVLTVIVIVGWILEKH